MKLEEIKNKTNEAVSYLVAALESGESDVLSVGLFFLSLERQRGKTRRHGRRDETELEGGWQGVRESAVSAKRFWCMFGAKPVQSETPVRARG
jgi:hypothetical protein